MIEKKFKQTEIGIIPESWHIFNVGKDCRVKARIGWQGLNTSEYLSHGDYGLITSTDIIDGKVNWRTCVFVNHDRYIQDTNIIIEEGDVLISKDGTIGKVAIVSEMPFPATLNSGVFVIRKNNKQISQNGLGLAFLSCYFQDFIKRLTAGSTIVHLYQKDIVNFCFPLPDIEEQQRIANALSDIDSLIISYDKLIAKKQAIKQGAMQQLLTGKKRLPGYSEPWVEKRFRDVAEMRSGGTPSVKNSAYYKGDIPFLSISDMTTQGKWIRKTEKFISEEGLANSSARICHKGTLLYAMYASLGKCSITTIDIAISQAVLGIDVDENFVCREFLYYYLCYIEPIVKNMGQQGTQANLSKQLVQNFRLIIPIGIREQHSIASILIDMDNEIETLKIKKEKYEKIKQGMMQQLLTGRIRLLS